MAENDFKLSMRPFIGATSVKDGKSGKVPQPLLSDVNKYLKSDGTWSYIPNIVFRSNPSDTNEIQWKYDYETDNDYKILSSTIVPTSRKINGVSLNRDLTLADLQLISSQDTYNTIDNEVNDAINVSKLYSDNKLVEAKTYVDDNFINNVSDLGTLLLNEFNKTTNIVDYSNSTNFKLINGSGYTTTNNTEDAGVIRTNAYNGGKILQLTNLGAGKVTVNCQVISKPTTSTTVQLYPSAAPSDENCQFKNINTWDDNEVRSITLWSSGGISFEVWGNLEKSTFKVKVWVNKGETPYEFQLYNGDIIHQKQFDAQQSQLAAQQSDIDDMFDKQEQLEEDSTSHQTQLTDIIARLDSLGFKEGIAKVTTSDGVENVDASNSLKKQGKYCIFNYSSSVVHTIAANATYTLTLTMPANFIPKTSQYVRVVFGYRIDALGTNMVSSGLYSVNTDGILKISFSAGAANLTLLSTSIVNSGWELA